MTEPSTPPTPGTEGQTPEQQALQDALAGLLAPVARLAVAQGLPFAAVEEMLKRAFVQAAADAHPGLLAHRKVSRISTTTGINRREVTRLTQNTRRADTHGRSLVDELYAHWQSDAIYRDAEGQPLTLPRQGPAPSFETLAQAITRDVHPRSLLQELVRLSLAQFDEATDTVQLARHSVPSGDKGRMLNILGANVGDHLSAAVENVTGEGNRHFEQALFADGLSDDTLVWLRSVVRDQWKALRQAVVPGLEARLPQDEAAHPGGGRRWRVGLYSFDESTAPPADEPGSAERPDASDAGSATAPAAPRKRQPKPLP